MDYVLYHSKCYDGFGAAYAAWNELGDEDTTYIPVGYGKEPPEMLDAKWIYIVDFSYDEKTLVAMRETCTGITVLDHHKTAQEALEPIIGKHDRIDIHFNMEKSGALMTWEYFSDLPAPLLIQHISDRDLWKFEMEGTKEVHAALVSYPMKFKLWDNFDVEDLKYEGATLTRMHNNLVDNIVKSSWLIAFEEHCVPVVNTSIAWSEVGHALLEKYPRARMVMSFTRFNDQTMFSVRSIKEFDCSEYSKRYGGGGHAQASGFKTSNAQANEILSQVVDHVEKI